MEVSAANSLRTERASLGVAKASEASTASAASSLNDPRLFKTETETTETVPDRETETTETVPDRETETETGETNRPLFLIVPLLVGTTKGHLVDPEGTESSHHRGNLCAQLIKNTGLLLDPALIKEGLGAASYRDKRYCWSPAFLDAAHIKKGFFFLICLFKIFSFFFNWYCPEPHSFCESTLLVLSLYRKAPGGSPEALCVFFRPYK